jgi:hypothetical protein
VSVAVEVEAVVQQNLWLHPLPQLPSHGECLARCPVGLGIMWKGIRPAPSPVCFCVMISLFSCPS